MGEAVIFVYEAQVGMKLADDVFLPDGSLLVKKETVLDENIITSFSIYHILEIKIYEDDKPINSDVLEVHESEETTRYYDKVRESDQFKRFEEEFSETVDDVKEEFNKIVKDGSEIDADKLLAGPIKIMHEIPNNLQLLDMIHSIRMYDDLTYVHSVNVSLLSLMLGKWLSYDVETVSNLALCGILHDIGKLQIPKKILDKPERLTDNEYSIMRKHVNFGYETLRDKDVDQRVKEACLLHHERCDGSGYPFGIKGDKIPLEAKIVAVADVYDAMTANRVYRSAICPFTVVDIMNDDAFSKFDPAIAIPFLRNIVACYVHNDVRLSDGRVGKVILINENRLSRPSVLVDHELIDLDKNRDLEITALIN